MVAAGHAARDHALGEVRTLGWALIAGGGALAQEAVDALQPPRLVACEVPFLPGPAAATVTLTVDELGKVVHVEGSEGEEPYLQALIDAAPGCVFEPAREAGVPVLVEVPLTWVFPGAPATAVGEAVGTYRVGPIAARGGETVPAAIAAMLPGTLGDPIRALQALPGVSRAPLDAGWLLIQGGEPGQTATFVDGVPVPLVFHLGGLTSVLDPAAVSEVRVFAGAPPVRYGGGAAAVVDVSPRVLGSAGGDDVAGMNLAWAHAYVEAPVYGGAGSLSLRRSWLDSALAVAVGPEGARIAPRFWDGAVRYDRERVGAAATVVSDEIDAPIGGGETVTVTQRYAWTTLRWDASRGPWSASARAWGALGARRVALEGREELAKQASPGLRVDVAAGGPAARGAAGVELRGSIDDIVRDGDARSGDIGMVAAYGEAGVGDDLRIDAGARVEGWVVRGRAPIGAVLPRVSAAWQPDPALRLFVRGGETAQTPARTLWIAYPEGPYLPLARARSLVGGGEWSRGAGTVGVDAWGRVTRGYTAFEADGSVGPRDERAWGGDLDARWATPSWQLRGLASWTSSRHREDAGDAWRASRFEQPVAVQLLVGHVAGPWTLAARGRWASGYPLSAEAPAQAFDLLTQQTVDLSVDQGGRADPFASFDLRVQREWRLPRVWWTVSLDLQNVTNRRVPEPVLNGIDDTRAVYAIGLPVLPLVGVRAVRTAGGPDPDPSG